MKKPILAVTLLALATLPLSAQADDWGPHHHPGPGWDGPPPGPHPEYFHHREHWHEGHWIRAFRDGREGWWWVIGDAWYFYPAPIYPYPEPPVYVQQAPPPPGYVVAPAPAPAPSVGIDKTTGGTIIGGAAGAIAGAQIGKGSGNVAAIAIGTLLGAFVGHEVGQSLDRADALAAQQAAQNAYQAPIGQAISWNNPQSGHSGTIVPVRDGTDANGAYCREFQQTVNVGGKQEQAYGTACRQPDGSWKIVQ
ncbi:MAG TPA: RT0821/Lpp0805 family surface protein [Candidatus Sulfotelmatobacter sp.]|nr:RT0821/Lpp0805 family surface protein [Candidatus Sulfotelmatobacter sp.]